MNIKYIFTLLLLFTTILLAGCYTKLGYYEAGNLKQKQDQQIEKTEKEIENASEGYYGRRKPTYRDSRSYLSDTYRVPYTPYYYIHVHEATYMYTL